MAIFDFFRNKKNQKEQETVTENQETNELLLGREITAAELEAELEKKAGEIEEDAFSEPAGDMEVKDLEELRRVAETQAKTCEEDPEKAEFFREIAVYVEALDRELKDTAARSLSVRGIDKEIGFAADRMVEDLKRERMESVEACLEALEDGVRYCRTRIPASEMGDKRTILKKRITILREYRKRIELCEEIDQLERYLRKAEVQFSQYDAEYRDYEDKLSKYNSDTVELVKCLLQEGRDVSASDAKAIEVRDLLKRQNEVLISCALSGESMQNYTKELMRRKRILVWDLHRGMITRLHLNFHMRQ